MAFFRRGPAWRLFCEDTEAFHTLSTSLLTKARAAVADPDPSNPESQFINKRPAFVHRFFKGVGVKFRTMKAKKKLHSKLVT
jgi:hypothetical protein